MSANSGNPLNVIQHRMQVLRAEREQTESEMEALEKEKAAIKHVLPRVIAELEQKRERLEHKNKEARTLDNAIEEIEQNYGHILFTSSFFTGSAAR
jgi:chromosome segregation ATPase